MQFPVRQASISPDGFPSLPFDLVDPQHYMGTGVREPILRLGHLRQLDHASATETLDTYSHLWPHPDLRTLVYSWTRISRG